MENRDQSEFSYYINKDLESFKFVLDHLAKQIENSFEVSPFNQKDWRMHKSGQMTRNVKCAYIKAFIESPYVRVIIKLFGFKSVYHVYKERELQDYCGIYGFYEHAKFLASSAENPEDELGEDFLAECNIVGKGQELLNKSLSAFRQPKDETL